LKIYVGGTFSAQERLRAEAETLHKLGHEITSSWLREASKPESLTYDQWMFQLSSKDVAEVFASDCLIMDLDGASTSGGRYVEWGVACHPLSTILRLTVGGRAHVESEAGYAYGCFNHLAHGMFVNWDNVRAYLEINHNTKNRGAS